VEELDVMAVQASIIQLSKDLVKYSKKGGNEGEGKTVTFNGNNNLNPALHTQTQGDFHLNSDR